MSALEIPSAISGKAVDALYAARDRGADMHQAAACVLADTAPLAVAAELRRLAALTAPGPLDRPPTEWEAGHLTALDEVASQLRARADELDGGL